MVTGAQSDASQGEESEFSVPSEERGQRQREEQAMSNCKRVLTTWLEANALYYQAEFLVELAEAGTQVQSRSPQPLSHGAPGEIQIRPSQAQSGSLHKKQAL